MTNENIPEFVLKRLCRDRQYIGVVDGVIIHEGQWHPQTDWQAEPDPNHHSKLDKPYSKKDVEVYSCQIPRPGFSIDQMNALYDWGYKKVVYVSPEVCSGTYHPNQEDINDAA